MYVCADAQDDDNGMPDLNASSESDWDYDSNEFDTNSTFCVLLFLLAQPSFSRFHPFAVQTLYVHAYSCLLL